ncbi:MAG: class B sortase [Lachnospiraceae bacterium]|nr:class B sortase [Lachnospiraceae bacterium]
MKSEKKALIIRVLLLIIIIVCIVQIATSYYLSIKNKKKQENIRDILEVEKFEQEVEGIQDDESDKDMRQRYEELYSINSDLVGWLSIEGTDIDYPVVQHEDNEYYLSHDFYGNEDKYGCLFVKNFVSIDPLNTNVIIYGHSMKDGSMFGSLDEYKSERFYKQHPHISFDTLYDEGTYDVIAVFESQVYEDDEDIFKYYQFYNANTEEEFSYFYDNVKKLSIYDTGVTAEYGDTFITLSTCSYHTEEGRFVVVAKLNKKQYID